MEHDEEVKNDVGEMLKAFGEQVGDTPVGDEPTGDEPKEEQSTGDEPAGEPVATDAPATSAPTTDSPTTAAPEEDEKDKLIRELREKLAEKEKVKEPEPEPEPQPEQPPEPSPLTFEEQDFIGDLDLDDLSRDPKEFNKLLNSVYQKAIDAINNSKRSLEEGVLRSIPNVVRQNVSIVTNLQRASEQFYNDNKDLLPFKKVVASVWEDVASANPDKSLEDLLTDVASEARSRLELQKKVNDEQRKTPPRLPKVRSGVRQTEVKQITDPLISELDEMNKTLRR